ncbi:hyaluronan-binding protein 2-like [Diretmus argenteus]
MNLKLLFLCLFLAVLIIPAEVRIHTFCLFYSGLKSRLVVYTATVEQRANLVDETHDDDDDDDDNTDWVLEIQVPEGQCNPNPCLHNGVCRAKGRSNFKCDCVKPFKGKTCQQGPNYCKKGICGRGECVLTSTAPFYQCKCKEPFQPPNCIEVALCANNPCKNGGTCVRDGKDVECECPPGYRGRFCQTAPGDCYTDEGESYRGTVSETEDGDECLFWNSHFVLENSIYPFKSVGEGNGLGPHNFCRNPDGDSMPWCFIRKGPKLLWDYCDVTECPETTDSAGPQPTAPQPRITEATQPPPTDTSDETTEAPKAPEAPKQFTTCGKPQPMRSVTRIYGGLKPVPAALPWQVSLQVRHKGSRGLYRHICGGVLIDSCWVLTAGHCIMKNIDMQVSMGSSALDLVEPTEQILEVEEAIVHENHRETPTAVYNDIGLLKLRGRNGACANETQFVKTACLPDVPLPDGKECTISGWGVTEESAFGSNHLLEAQVLLINQAKCSERNIYGTVLDNGMLCAGHLQGGVDSCQGDSGGPLTCQRDTSNVIYGLVSWGDKCGMANKPGVYTRVTHFLDWIKSKTQPQQQQPQRRQ